jgi:nitroimidazol reductase NimA-like FMN-containing flavoprotein (pyridoxamine 5'-phosphate oxidase superfamily)
MDLALDPRYSDPGSEATPWEVTASVLGDAEMFTITTVRADGRPHVVPLLALWDAGALHLVTGPDEQKYRNLRHASLITLTTTTGNRFAQGVDVTVEGQARRVTDQNRLEQLAVLWPQRFGSEWHYEVRDGSFWHEPGEAHVFALEPDVVRTFTRGPYRQTTYRNMSDLHLL